jgi:hypothetical protein
VYLNACSFSISMYLCVCGFSEQLAEHKVLVGGLCENGNEPCGSVSGRKFTD